MSRIPANVSDLKAKLKKTFGKAPEAKADDAPTTDNLSRRSKAELQKQKEKNRAVVAELNDAKTSDARKQEIIDGLQAQLEAAETERDEHKAKVEELTPKAKAWSNFEHKERTKLLENFPPEKKAAAKKVIDSLDIETAREYASGITGKGANASGDTSKGKGGKIDWNKLVESANTTEGAATLEKAIAEDTAGFNAFSEGK